MCVCVRVRVHVCVHCHEDDFQSLFTLHCETWEWISQVIKDTGQVLLPVVQPCQFYLSISKRVLL